jgi:hypothetical protein
MNSYNLNVIQDTLNKMHPKQIINKVDNLKVSMFKVKYEYTTDRNNKKEGEKYFLLNTLNPQADLQKELLEYVQDYNENNEHRQISNVKFLDGQCLAFLSI